MKRFAIAALAAAAFAAPFAFSSTASADPPPGRGNGHANGQGHSNGHGNPNNPHTQGRHDNGLHRGWDRRRFNGYEYRGVWHYGPPPVSLAEAVAFGYRPWRRGDRLPAYYRDLFDAVDYRVLRLAPPPVGYQYVRDDRDNYLLIGAATGVILSVIGDGLRY